MIKYIKKYIKYIKKYIKICHKSWGGAFIRVEVFIRVNTVFWNCEVRAETLDFDNLHNQYATVFLENVYSIYSILVNFKIVPFIYIIHMQVRIPSSPSK